MAKWNGKLIAVSYLLKNFVRIATDSESCLWSMAKAASKSKFHPYVVFSTWALLRDGGIAKREFYALQ